jgi:alanyl-tRNA synthetase
MDRTVKKVLESSKLKTLYLEFFKERGHKEIPNASLIPEHDKTVLFTTAGMHPLIPYLIGKQHPMGRRLVNVQRCLRTGDIFEIGDDFHNTFFEMLGNWSLGDYFKKESIEWSFEFLTDSRWLGLAKSRLYVSVFAGDSDAPRDEESAAIWQQVGIPKDRIYYLPKGDNWWGPAGATGPCGPDTEIFYDTGKEPHGPSCRPADSCGKYFEIWNNVFMEYNKTSRESYQPLKQRNVDTGLGVERTVAVLNGLKSVYEIDTFKPLMEKINELLGVNDADEAQLERSKRIIADHVRAATFIMAERVSSSNVGRGYILRRLLRRSMRHGKLIGIEGPFLNDLTNVVINTYSNQYSILTENREFIVNETNREEKKFGNTINIGLKKFNQISAEKKQIDGKDAFLLFQSFGFPIEMTRELGEEKGIPVDVQGFDQEFARHQQVSRHSFS